MTDIQTNHIKVKPRFLRTPEAAVYLGLSARTLEKHRCYGTGPVYFKLGGRVVYSIDELERWFLPAARRSTSDPGSGVVHPAKRRDQVPGGEVHPATAK
jgi:predicted DNA-binding transcriptional regulator AlpA